MESFKSSLWSPYTLWVPGSLQSWGKGEGGEEEEWRPTVVRLLPVQVHSNKRRCDLPIGLECYS